MTVFLSLYQLLLFVVCVLCYICTNGIIQSKLYRTRETLLNLTIYFQFIKYFFCKNFTHLIKILSNTTAYLKTPCKLDTLSFHPYRYWNIELERHKRGLTPRLWFAILQCFKWRLLMHGILFFIVVSSTGACMYVCTYVCMYVQSVFENLHVIN